MCAQIQTILTTVFEEYKDCVPQRLGKGRHGYSYHSILNAFALMIFRGIRSEEGLVEYLNEYTEDAKACGFSKRIPHRTTFGRFRKKVGPEFIDKVHSELIRKYGKLVEHVLVDATALENKDLDSKVGYTPTKGFFNGFKAHILSDAEMRIPLSVLVTQGNRQDGPMFPDLIKNTFERGCNPKFATTDAGYDSEKNHRVAKLYGVLPVIPLNKRNLKNGKAEKFWSMRLNPDILRNSELYRELQSKRFAAEEVNSALKQLVDTRKLHVRGLKNIAFYIHLACLLMAAFYFVADANDDFPSPWKVCHLRY